MNFTVQDDGIHTSLVNLEPFNGTSDGAELEVITTWTELKGQLTAGVVADYAERRAD